MIRQQRKNFKVNKKERDHQKISKSTLKAAAFSNSGISCIVMSCREESRLNRESVCLYSLLFSLIVLRAPCSYYNLLCETYSIILKTLKIHILNHFRFRSQKRDVQLGASSGEGER